MRLLYLLCCLPGVFLSAQRSTFDFSNEGWTADGDALNGAAVWISNGGNPGGHIETDDASTGGTWYFVAPAKFWGPKCDAYNKFLKYDQFTSDNTVANNNPDIQIKGGGITLVFNNPVLPGTTWTHYEILLREDAGWRINSLTGATPTEAQFRTALSNVTTLRIRGEYLSSGVDYGGLDNVILESDIKYTFDLDLNNSSGLTGGDFQANTVCSPNGPVADDDLFIESSERIDSINLKIAGGSAFEFLELDALLGNITIVRYGSSALTLINNSDATADDFTLLVKQIQYHDTSPNPVAGTRVTQIRVYTACGAIGSMQRAFLPVILPPVAGLPGDTVLCHGTGLTDLRLGLRGQPDFDGYWAPAFHSGNYFFDPAVDSSGVYRYIVTGQYPCKADTSQVAVQVEYPFQLQPDTTLCYDKTMQVRAPSGLQSYAWSTGSHSTEITVDEAGTYALEGATDYCTFSDSVVVGYYTCVECPPYAPNVFSPNDDGQNDGWHIFLPCHWTQYLVEVYDRWGELVFRSLDPETEWDGRNRDREALPGVYVWRMRWTGEQYGVPRTWEYEGDVTVYR